MFLKSSYLLLFLLISSTGKAIQGFSCIPSARETRIQVLIDENTVKMTIVNPMGYQFMPQFDNATSVFNIPFLSMQGEDLKDLSDGFTVSWPKKLCTVDTTNFTIGCTSEALNKINSIKPLGLTTTEITEKYEAEIYSKRKFRFTLENINVYFLSLQFDTRTCKKYDSSKAM